MAAHEFVTRIAPSWAEAIGLSPGACLSVQLVDGSKGRARPWGPDVLVVPEVDAALDELLLSRSLVGWTSRSGGCTMASC